MKAVYWFVFFLFLILFSSNSVNSQEYVPGGARSHALAGITACLSDEWSSLGNQAGLSDLSHPGLGITASRVFLLNEMGRANLSAHLPVGNNTFAISYYRFGHSAYNENKIGLAYAKRILPDFSAGFQFNYWSIHLPENRQMPSCFVIEGGIQYHISSRTILGCHFFNPTQTGVKNEFLRFKLPSVIRMGISSKLSEDILIACELEKDLQFDLCTKFGLEWSLSQAFRLRAGMAVKPNNWTMGIAYRFRNIQADFAWQYQLRLGNTPSLSLFYTMP